MIISATELARNTQRILDQVTQRGEVFEIQRYGKTVAIIKPQVGVTRSELLRILDGRGFTEKDSSQLKSAIESVRDVIGQASL